MQRNKRERISWGLTRIEVLVIVAAGGLLAGLLGPALAQARDKARGTTCADRIHRLIQGVIIYSNENLDWFPGVNASGFEVREKAVVAGALNSASLPVQSFDWMTPAVLDYQLPANRAQRMHALLADLGCPQQAAQATLDPQGLANCIDRQDFLAFPHWSAPSYLAPAYFSCWGSNYANTLQGYQLNSGAPIYARTIPTDWEVGSTTFKANWNYVTRPELKIAIADATRYVAGNGSVVIDPQPDPALYGTFASSGAWWAGSNEYGVRAGTHNWNGAVLPIGNASSGANLPLSYRHTPNEPLPLWGPPDGSAQRNTGAINAAFYDGHVARLGDRASREISAWYPSGAVVQHPAEGMTTEPAGYVIP